MFLIESRPVSQCSSTPAQSAVSAGNSQEARPKGEDYLEALLLEASDAEAGASEVTLLQMRQSKISASIIEKKHMNDTVARSPSSVVAPDSLPSAALREASAEVFGSRRRMGSFSMSPRRRSSSFSISPRRRSFSMSPRRRSGARFVSPRRRSVHAGHGGYHPEVIGYDHHLGFGYQPAYGEYGPHYFHGYSYNGGGILNFIIGLILMCVCCPVIFIIFGCVSCMQCLSSCFPCCFPRCHEFSDPYWTASPPPSPGPTLYTPFLQSQGPDASQALRHAPIALKAEVCSDEVAIPHDVARDFLVAVRDEYLNGVDCAVQVLFDELESRGFSAEIGRALDKEEQRFQHAAGKRAVYEDLVARWGAEEVLSNGVAIPLDLAQAFLTAIQDEYLNGLDHTVGLFFDDLTIRGVSQDICRVLDEEEQRFHNTFDRERTYHELALRWGMA